MDILFAKELTKVGIICNIWIVNKMASKSLIFWNNDIFWNKVWNKIIFWSNGFFWNKVSIVACISLILSSKVNKVDFKSLESFLENIIVVSGKSKLKVIKNEFNKIW